MYLPQKILKCTVALVLLCISFALPSAGACACAVPTFHSDQTEVTSVTTNPEQIIYWDGSKEDFFVDFKLEGTAKDFGVVMPLPAEPIVSKGSKAQFEELRALTERKEKPKKNTNNFGATSGSGLQVVKVETVGSYTVSTLRAEKTDDLLAWLSQNGYAYTNKDKENFSYYVEKRGYYFVVIKINVNSNTDDVLRSYLKKVNDSSNINMSTADLDSLVTEFKNIFALKKEDLTDIVIQTFSEHIIALMKKYRSVDTEIKSMAAPDYFETFRTSLPTIKQTIFGSDINAASSYDLHPLIFSFNSVKPYLPLRYLAHHNELPTTLTLYTIAPKPILIPGTGISYSNAITAADGISTFSTYEMNGKWLTASTVHFDVNTITKDPDFIQWDDPAPVHIYVGDPEEVITSTIRAIPGISASENSEPMINTQTSFAGQLDANTSYPFADAKDHYAREAILQLASRNIISGRSAGVFAPDQLLNRAESSKIISLAFFSEGQVATAFSSLKDNHPAYTYAYFKDVQMTSWYASYVALTKEKGIFQGTQQGTFEPSRPITRAEFLKIILTAKGLMNQQSSPTSATFSDVPAKHWAFPYVEYAVQKGIIISAHTFGPDIFLTRGEAADLLWKVMNIVN